MHYVSDIYRGKPESFRTDLQKQVYQMLEELEIAYERVETDEVITMEDCLVINKKT